ncbi:hypothetical protein LJR231_002071 [Phyllobacterium sp. LjRoot231]
MPRRTTILIAAIIAVAAIVAVFLVDNPAGDAENAGQPAPHALDQTN